MKRPGFEYTPLEHRLRAEIHQQSDAYACGLEIIEKLYFMRRNQLAHGLDFDYEPAFDEKIGSELAHHGTPEVYLQWCLLGDVKTVLANQQGKGILVHALEEATAELVVHGIEAANDPLGEFFLDQE